MNSFDDLLNNAPAEGQQRSQLSKEEYAAMKQAGREELYALSDQTALEVAGDGGKFQQYIDTQAKHGRSAVNTLLIMAQETQLPNGSATRVNDYDGWKDQGAYVKKNPISISILDGHEYTKEDGTPGVGYDRIKVYDISQVDTRRMKFTPPPSYDDRQLLRALVNSSTMKITGAAELPGDLGAMTNPETGEISVRKGMEFADTFRSLSMELAAAALENSNFVQTDPQFSAYCASYLLCKKYGVDTRGFNFTDAPSVFDGLDAQGIKGQLQQMRDAAGDISAPMAKQLDAAQRAAKSQEAR